MSWARLRWLVLALALAGVVWAGRDAVRRVLELRRVDRICSATAAGEWQRAVDSSTGLVLDDQVGLRGLECRCRALLELGEVSRCAEELTAVLAGSEQGDWLPAPALVSVAVNHLMSRGELAAAADLAQRANRRYGDTPLLLMQELLLRSQVEDEIVVLDDIEARWPALGQAGNQIAFALVDRFLLRQQWDRAGAILAGVQPLPEQVDTWFELDTELLASQGDAPALRRSFERWREMGGKPADLEARYAYLVSVKGLLDPSASHRELLERAVADDERIEDRELAAAVRSRLIRYLAFLGDHDAAVALYDESVRKYGEVAGVTRAELLPSASQRWLQGHAGEGRSPRGTLIFRGGLAAGDTLWASPDPVLAVDAPFQAYPVDSRARVKVTRSLGEAPVRWVVRDAENRVVASGAVWPDPGRRQEVRIARRAPLGSVPWSKPAAAEPDGRRRVLLLVLDCADWRLLRFLEARRELPVLSEMAGRGVRGVLLSEPPFTAAALGAIVHPEPTAVSFPGLLFQLGEEVEALNFVGRNPFAFLQPVLPGTEDLFESLGQGDLVLANLLRSKGAIQAGRNAQVTGPDGRVGELSGYRSARPLEPREIGSVTGLADDPERQNPLVEEIAADFDTAIAVWQAGEVDLLALRVAAFDILTHANYGPLMTSGQDDGDRTLLRIYSYVDLRTADLMRVVDGDDIMIVMSDHGIRNTLEHDPNCVFIAAAPGIGPSRLIERPEIRGTGRMIADLFAVKTGWPATGMESWVPLIEVEDPH